jgi:hypothetical protein
MSNTTKGRTSYDLNIDNTIIPFFNRNISEYPTETLSPKFDLIPVREQKDLMINHARLYAQQEYDRIMDLVSVLEKQAQDIKRRLDITDAVYKAQYEFQPVMGQSYWLVWNKRKEITILISLGPNDWSSSHPEYYEYQVQVRYMGDHTWMEVSNELVGKHGKP